MKQIAVAIFALSVKLRSFAYFNLSDENVQVFRERFIPKVGCCPLGFKFCINDYYSREEFYTSPLKHGIGHAFVYSPCISTYTLGNSLGMYFHALTCTVSAGLTFIVNQKLANQYSFQSAFIQRLPNFYRPLSQANSNTSFTWNNSKQIEGLLRSSCSCHWYCWENSSAPWAQYSPLIRKLLRDAAAAHLEENRQRLEHGLRIIQSQGDQLHCPPHSIVCKNTEDHIIPATPDVFVHYRCGDNVPGGGRYGFVPFAAILGLIPSHVKSIYISTDPRRRERTTAFSESVCPTLLSRLYDRISEAFPDALVVLKFGDDVLLDYVRMTFAAILVCSPSTFCLWPAIACKGTAYFPITSLVLNASVGNLPDLGPNFKWINTVDIVKNFTHNSTLEDVMSSLA